ncbi:MAG: hypothetical protein J7M40_13370, partial [Planctomycetes bacterium]|nr:hypothetical protein [Planctomycetota bacterium]
EFYDLANDPDCLKNLIDSAEQRGEIRKMQSQLGNWMKQSGDPLLSAFENRNSPEKLKAALIDIYGANYTRPANKQPNAARGNRKKKRRG